MDNANTWINAVLKTKFDSSRDAKFLLKRFFNIFSKRSCAKKAASIGTPTVVHSLN